MLIEKYRIRFEKHFLLRFFAFLLDTFGLPLKFYLPKAINRFPKKILIIRKDDLGDLVLSIPMYEAIKEKFPSIKITVMCSKIPSEILKKNPHVDEIRVVNKNLKILDILQIIRWIRGERFDIGIDPKGSLINVILMYFGKIHKTISYWNVSGGKFLLTDPVFYKKQIHESGANLKLLRPMGVKAKNHLPKVYLSKKEKKDVKSLIEKLKLKKFVAVYATPTSLSKRWPEKNLKEVLTSLPDTSFLFVAQNKDKDGIEKIIINFKNCKTMYDLNLRKLSYLFSFADKILSVDGGPMHLAWIANKNAIALFGQNDIDLWRPLNNGVVLSHFPKSMQGPNKKPLKLNVVNNYMKAISSKEVIQELEKKSR